MTRTLAVTVAEWPAVAAGLAPDDPAVVVSANRVVAVTDAAVAAGVGVGLRRREAQARCPALRVVPVDGRRDAREFESVLAAIAQLCPRLEVIRPGCCTFPTRGPSRYFGGDGRLAVRVKETVEAALPGPGVVRVGVADGRFTARIAADMTVVGSAGGAVLSDGVLSGGVVSGGMLSDGMLSGGVVVVPAGGSAGWLADLPVSILATDPAVSEQLVDLFRRLGLITLGLVAALPAGDVLARFGAEGVLAHRLAAGLDDRPAVFRGPAEETAVEVVFETPLERAETAGFAARALAGQLGDRLAVRGWSCALLGVVAETEHGERSERRWRLGPGPIEPAVAERVRWQLDGWLNGPVPARPTGGVTRLRLVPEEVAPAGGAQLQLWGQPTAPPEQVVRAIARLEGLLGADAVTVPQWRGGRQPGQQAVRVPAAAVDRGRRAAPQPSRRAPVGETPTWPGGLPSPSPTVVFAEESRPPVDVVDGSGEPVGVGARPLPASPAVVVIGGRPRKVAGWSEPWPLVERWWDPQRQCRQVRVQVLVEDGSAYLMVLESGRWWLAGIYD